ncbi:MAG: hypothetical protein WCW17_04395 [Patescibacteria group bacterium]|jgi:hypothetical protein
MSLDPIKTIDENAEEELNAIGCRLAPEKEPAYSEPDFSWIPNDIDPKADFNGRNTTAGRIEMFPRNWVVTKLECHPDFEEIYTASRGCYYPLVEAGRTPSRDNLKVIWVDAGRSIVIGKGVWHCPPFVFDDNCDATFVRVIHPADERNNDTVLFLFVKTMVFE